MQVRYARKTRLERGPAPGGRPRRRSVAGVPDPEVTMSPAMRCCLCIPHTLLLALLACQPAGSTSTPAPGVPIVFENETGSAVRVYLVVQGDRYPLGLAEPGRATVLRAAPSLSSPGDRLNLAVLPIAAPGHGGPRADDAMMLTTDMSLMELTAQRWVLQGALLVGIPR